MLLGVLAFPASASAQTGWKWFDQSVLKRITVAGERRLGYHVQKVTGDFEAYSSLNYQGDGGSRFTDSGSMTLSGQKVAGLLNFQISFSANRFADPQQQRITLNADRGPYSILAGDIVGSLLNTNSLMSFGRSLKGASITYRKGRTAVKALRSETKGTARTVTIEGANSSGPYYLQSGRLITDSIAVRVDGVDMKLLENYVVDADLGTITFVDRVIGPTSTITVTYETYGFNTQRGVIEGAGMSYDIGRFGRVGLTGIRQTGRGTTGTNSRIESFQGFGDASIPYFLQFKPTLGTVIIKVNGIDQIEGPPNAEGGDYYFDPANSQVFYFKRFIANTLTITATYRPVAEQTLDGDRRAWGLDYRVPLGKGTAKYLQYNQSLGELLNPDNPLSAVARSIDLRYNEGNWNVYGAVKDIPRDYVTVESRGFNRNEKSANLTVERQSSRYTYGASTQNSSVTSRVGTGANQTFRVSRSTDAGVYARFNSARGTNWSVEQRRRTSKAASGSTLDTTSISADKALSTKLRTKIGLEHQVGRGNITIDNSTQQGSINLDTLKATVSYFPTEELIFSGRAGVTQTRALGETGIGNDLSMSAVYQGKGRWSGSANVQVSRAGQLANVGFDNGTGTGYADSGFNSGALGDGSFGVGGTNARRFSLTSAYQASDRLAIRSTFFDTEAKGSLTSNAHSTGVDLSTQWDLGKMHLLDLSLSQTRTRFLNSLTTSKSDSTVFDFYFTGAPNKLSYSLGINALISGAKSEFSSDSLGVSLGMAYQLTPKQVMGLAGNWGRTRGYYPQDDKYVTAFYRYRFFQTLSLEASYKWRNVRNLDPLVTSGSYASSGFDFELLFDFGS